MTRPLNILIAEDSQDDVDLILRELRHAGFDPKWKRVETEPDFLAEIKNQPDIILSDYSMPQFSGLRAAQLLRKSGLDIPFILVSGTVGEDTAVEAMKMGATDYLLKDRLARLGQAVERALLEAKERGELKKAEQRIAVQTRALESAANAIMITDLQGKILSVNTAFCVMTGYTAQEMIGQNPRMLKSGRHGPDSYRALWETVLAGQVWRGEMTNRRKDGTSYHEEMTVTPVRADGGEITHFIAIKQDITEQKRMEEVLRKLSGQETGRKKKRLIRDLVVIFVLTLLTFAILSYTNALQLLTDKFVIKYKEQLDDMIGIAAIVLLGFFVFSYRRWQDVQSHVVEQANIEEALRRLHGELEKSVQQRTAELARTNEALRNEIAKHRQAREELVWKTTLLEAQMDSSIDGILVVDSQGKKILQNQRLNELWKIPPHISENKEDAVQIRFVTDRTKNPKQFVDKVAHLYSHPDEISQDEIELVDGTILDRYSAPVLDPAGKHYGRIWSFRDITGRKKLEEQFRQSQKMEAIGHLAGGVAHDFNNILAVIQMQAGMLRGEQNLSSTQMDYAAEIEKAAQRAANLTSQLLLFSRRQAMRPRDIDLNDVVTNITKMLQRIFGENIEMQFKFAARPLFIHADSGMIDQVLMNLAVNARDAMPKGGRLVFETSSVEFDESIHLQSPHARPGLFACLGVSDTGCGIPPEILPHIFEPFFTTKGVGKGTGLGLATVFGIVQQHNGWVNVCSEFGNGTTFRVYLPLLARNTGQPVATQSIADVRGGNETILLVEDEAPLCALMQRVLTSLGYRVIEAPTAFSALENWKHHRDEIQLLLTDMILPGDMNGKELAKKLLQENPKLKVIYTSGYSAEVAGKDFPLEEGVNFLAKPYQTHKLAMTVRQSLDAGRPPQPA